MVQSNAAKQSKEIDALHAQLYPVGEQAGQDAGDQGAAPGPAAAENAGGTQDAQGQTQAPADPAAAPASPEQNQAAGTQPAQAAGTPEQPATVENLQQSYDSLKGKYNAEVPQLHEQVRTQQEMINAMSAEHGEKLTTLLQGGELTQDEIDDVGEDLIGVIGKVAEARFAPVVNQLQQQNDELRERLKLSSENIQQSTRASMLAALKAQVPDFEEVNKAADFLDWLATVDTYSGLTRQQMLSQAFEANDTNRVISFFRGYKQGQTVSPPPQATPASATPVNPLEALISPGKPAGTGEQPGAQVSGKVWTTAEIAEITKQKTQRRLSPEQIASFDAEIHAAAAEGRIQG